MSEMTPVSAVQQELIDVLGVSSADFTAVRRVGHPPPLAGSFAVADLAESALRALLAVAGGLAGQPASYVAPRLGWHLASDRYSRPVGAPSPNLWDDVSGDRRTSDGWVRIHANYAHHRAAALSVLDCAAGDVGRAVEQWSAVELQEAIVAAGGCCVAQSTRADWLNSGVGRDVDAQPLIRRGVLADIETAHGATAPRSFAAGPMPLAGIKVLDLTRVIAGPVATRWLASLGANVLRIDPPGFVEASGLEIDTTLGKRAASCDVVRDPRFEALAREADVIVHGLRPGALAAAGWPDERLASLRSGVVIGQVSAYGPGTWGARRGFDSLVQVACGITAHQAVLNDTDQPSPLPVQLLDHASGYLLAAGVLAALRDGGGSVAVSLARTASWLWAHPTSNRSTLEQSNNAILLPEGDDIVRFHGPLGYTQHLAPLASLGGQPLQWAGPPRPIGHDALTW
jgi:CoA-transferase family III